MSNSDPLISNIYIEIDGADAAAEIMQSLLEVTVENSLHLPDMAAVVLHDPELKWIDHTGFEPGKALVIKAKSAAGGTAAKLFEGEIVELEPDFQPATQQFTIRAFDKLHRLGHGKLVRSFLNMTDGDVVKKVANDAGLTVRAGPTTQVHPFVLQANQTNIEFLRGRATALGFLLYVEGNTLHFEAPPTGGQPVSLEWGKDLFEFHPRLTTVGQVSRVTVRGWDPTKKQAIVGQAQNGTTAPQIGQSRNGGALVQSAFNIAAQALITDRPVRTQAAADQHAQAVADRRAGRFIEADATAAGNPAIVAGASVSLSAVGDRFKGKYLVTGTTHIYSAEAGYTTRFTVSGAEPATLLSVLSPEPEEARMPGFVIGIVTDNQDPDGLGRVKVKYPYFSDDHTSDWARLVILGGGSGRGFEFVPEVNDEVLVGFELGDVHCPYILGGLWNGRDAAPTKSNQLVSGGKVQKRIIRSRTGHIVTLDDSDNGGGVSVVDSKGNKIELNTQQNSLTIEVKGDASIKADGNMTLEAKGSVEIKGLGATVDAQTGQLQAKGMGATMDAGTGQLQMKSSVSASLDGGPSVQVKGLQISLG